MNVKTTDLPVAAIALTLVTAVTFMTPGATAQEDRMGTRVEVTAVSVLIDARDAGGPVTDLTAGDLEVAEDGVPVRILGLLPLIAHTPMIPSEEPMTAAPAVNRSPPVPITIYIDSVLSGTFALQPATEALAGESVRLTAVGPVSVVLADKTIETVLEPTEDSDRLAAILTALAKRGGGPHAVERIRRRFLHDLTALPVQTFAKDAESRGQSATRAQVRMFAGAAASEEAATVTRSTDRLREWALRGGSGSPKILLLVGSGFDEDPVPFYLPFVESREPEMREVVRRELERNRHGERIEALGRDLAAAGWRVTPFAASSTGSSLMTAEFGGAAITGASSPVPLPDRLMIDPIGAQRHIAAASGGEVVVGSGGLTRHLDGMTGWYRLTYQVSRAPDGALHDLMVTSQRPTIDIRTPEVIASETSQSQATTRLFDLLDDYDRRGDLEVDVIMEAAYHIDPKQLSAEATIVADLDPVAPLLEFQGPSQLRLSVAVKVGDHQPMILHRRERLERTGEGTVWYYQVPLRWPEGPARMAVIVEELGTGVWGGTLVDLPE